MYKPPFSSFKKAAPDPMQPIGSRVGPSAKPGGTKVFECPTVSKVGTGPVKQQPRVQLVDHRKVRMQASNVDRRKDIVDTPTATMSTAAADKNLEFETELETAKTHEFWVFPEECTSVFMDKRTGLAYANVCLIGINGRQWPLFPGNNRAPAFVYEALETHRELQKRYKQKIAPPKSSGRSILFSDPRSGLGRTGGKMITNPNIFNDSMLGRPNVYDSSQDAKAAAMIRQHREISLKSQK